MKKTLTLLLLLAGLTLDAQERTLTWTGAESDVWNYEAANWLDEDGNDAVYRDGDAVEFGDLGSGAVALDCIPSPASVLVNSDKDYTFTGHRFQDGTQLTKSGRGTLTINFDGNEIGVLVKEGTLVLGSDHALGPEPNVTLEGGTLDLGGNTFNSVDSHFILKGNTNSIGNGTFNGVLTVPDDSTLTLCGDLGGEMPIILREDSTLNLGGHTLTKCLEARVYATISHGKIVLDEDLLGGVLEDVTLDLNGNTTYYCTPESLKGSCSIGNGTIRGFMHTLRVERDSTLTLFGITYINGVTVTAGNTNTTVKALKEDTPGLLQELTVSNGLIAGTDRQVSRADGLKIESKANLMIKSMTLTAHNEIHVGEHTITLKDVTIKVADGLGSLAEGIYTIDLRNLINCDLVMENVLLDASDLSLPQGFDFAKDAVAFDFGDDVTIKQATGLDMRLGNYWSPSLNLQDGKVVFKNLVETPEPTTGTLSLLALAALSSRRRRK